MKGQVRVAYARHKLMPQTLTGEQRSGGAGAKPAELQGKYFRVLDRVYALADGYIALKVVPQTSDAQWGYMTFVMSGGDGVIHWSDAEGNLPGAPPELLQRG